MNKKIKFLITTIIFIITVFLLSSFLYIVNGAEKTTLKQVKTDVCEIKKDEDNFFTKKIISISDENKEVIMQMNIENPKHEKQIDPAEIFFVIDNSGSMSWQTSTGATRQSIINGAAKKLAKKILQFSQNTKIGVIQFYDSYSRLEDAKIEIQPTNELTEIESAINNIISDGQAGTNTDAGLQLAKQSFTSNKNRTIILLTDGAPNLYVGGNYLTSGESEVINKTKQTLQSVIDNNINLITVLTEVDDTYEFANGPTEKQVAEQVYGTQSNPNFGKFYYVSDAEAEDTILNLVYSGVENIISNDLKNISIVDVFPQDIIDNYDIEIVQEPTIGKATLESDKISWNIEVLKEGQSSSLQYKLKLKENYNKEIINVETNTNEKVDINYKNKDGENNTKTSKITPSIILEKNETSTGIKQETKTESKEETKVDTNSKATNATLPQAGLNAKSIILIIAITIISLTITYIRYVKKYKGI